jgi:putative ABC transport system permease protein
MSLRRAANGLLALFRRTRLEDDLAAEIAAHLELAEREALDAGLSPEEARRAALIRFGGIEHVKEDHRDRRGIRWLETFLRDLRFGFASILREPGFAAVSIGVLALGIGANTAMFSLVDATLLKPLPFPEPERIVRVWETPTPDSINGFTTLDFLDWKRLNTVFEAFSVERGASLALTGEGEPVRLEALLVSADYFQVFGVDAALGRTFVDGEDQPGAAAVVLLSHATWETRFGGDPDILQRTIDLDNREHTVVGVLPQGVFDRHGFEIWKPLVFAPDQMNRSTHWLRSVGRREPGVSIEQAQAEMSAIDARLTELTPTWKKDWGVLVEPYDRRLVDDRLKQSLTIAFAAVALVLLIACANVANLLLAKGVARRKEMAVRAALGATRGRLIVQLLTESLVLCAFGGLSGLLLARLLLAVAKPLIADSLPFTADVSLDPRVLGFSAVATLGVSLLIGLLPSLQTSFARLAQAMNQGARGSSASREGLRRAIVVGEVAVSLILICGSTLLFKSLYQLQQVETGVRVADILTMTANLPYSSYSTPDSATRFMGRVVEELRATPGVSDAAVASDLPFEGVGQGEGLGMPGSGGIGTVRFKRVDDNYFSALDIPALAGRGLEQRDRAGAPNVVVINEQTAARLLERYEMADPVGQTVWISTPNYENSEGRAEDYQIVGIVRSERTNEPADEQDPVAYVPLAQFPHMDLRIVVRAQGRPAAVMPGVMEAIRRVDPNLPIGDIRTLDQIRGRSLSGAAQPAWLIGAFALTASFLAALGLYGVLSHTVTQQRREIGIRMALGAQSGDVLSRVLGSAATMVSLGVALGLAGAFALTRLMESLLFQVSALDPFALAAACVLTLLVSLAAGLIPARRAARVEPMTVLREEA